jgi:O-antigen ligase
MTRLPATLPERLVLALICTLPFFVYPAAVGGHSLFLGLPLSLAVSALLLANDVPWLRTLARSPLVISFALLLAIASLAALISVDVATSLSRVLYLFSFGTFALALASALRRGRLSREQVAWAIVAGGSLAAAALLLQSAAQFVFGQDPVFDWLRDVQSAFAGERAAAIEQTNWVPTGTDLLRGIFPFMSPPSAGQYLMLTLVAATWLWARGRDRREGDRLALAALVLIAVALLATYSRQAWLGAIAGLLLLALLRREWRVVLPAVVLAVALLAPLPSGGEQPAQEAGVDSWLGATDTSKPSSGVRIELWREALDLIPEHAAIGVGPGLYGTLNPEPANPVYYAHNVFLDAAVELGLGGLAALAAVFALGLFAALRRSAFLSAAMLVAFLAASMLDDVLYFPRNGLLLATAFALIAGGAWRESATLSAAAREPSAEPGPPDGHGRYAERPGEAAPSGAG